MLLSLRDDFLIRCHEHAALAPVFERADASRAADARTALRRALVEPAQQARLPLRGRGARRRDGARRWRERGARCRCWPSPSSRLWERRDRERKLLTRAAYEEIGGVAGALAQHAEATLERIGTERAGDRPRDLPQPRRRRRARARWCDREELLSALPGPDGGRGGAAAADRRAAADVATRWRARRASRATTGSRSCTSRCSRPGRGSCAGRRRTRRARSCATSSSRRRTCGRRRGGRADLLWTGTSFREYELWRERYPGALTALEEDFARAMTDRARRQAAAAAGGGGGRAIVGAEPPWPSSWASRHQARAPAEAPPRRGAPRRASSSPSAGPRSTATRRPPSRTRARASSSPTPPRRDGFARRGAVARAHGARPADGQRGAALGSRLQPRTASGWRRQALVETVSLFRADGTLARTRCRRPRADRRTAAGVKFDAGQPPARHGDLARRTRSPAVLGVGRKRAAERRNRRNGRSGLAHARDLLRRRRSAPATVPEPASGGAMARVAARRGIEPRTLARMATTGICQAELDLAGRRIVYGRGRSVFLRELAGGPDRLVGTHDQPLDEKGQCLALAPSGDRVASIDTSREVRIWSLRPGETGPARAQGDGQPRGPVAGPLRPERLAPGWGSSDDRAVYLWDVGAPRDAQPVRLRRPDAKTLRWSAFTPDGEWLAVMDGSSAMFWPVGARHSYVLRGHTRGPVSTSRSPPTRGGWPRRRSTARGCGRSTRVGRAGTRTTERRRAGSTA